MKLNQIISLFAIVLLLSACKVNRPDDVLPPKTMEAVLYDYHLAQAILMDAESAEKYKRDFYLDWVYQKNGVTKEEFDNSLVWYTRYPEEFAEIYEKLSERVTKDRNQAAMLLERIEKSSFSVESGDSVDLWYLNNTVIMSNSIFLDKLTYSIKADTTFHKGDTIIWNVNSTFVAPDSLPLKVYLAMSLRYGADRVVTVDTLLDHTSEVTLMSVTDTVADLNSLTGFVSYIDTIGNQDACIVLSNMSLIRQR